MKVDLAREGKPRENGISKAKKNKNKNKKKTKKRVLRQRECAIMPKAADCSGKMRART